MIKIILKQQEPFGVIKEELFGGTIATVYHQTALPPQRFQEILEKDQFRGTIGVYGRGLYATLSPNNRVLAGNAYGEYTYRCKVNLHGYIIFSKAIVSRIYGATFDPLQQIKDLYGPALAVKIQSMTSDFSAESISDILKTTVKGIVITDRKDNIESAVVLTYDPSTVVPIAYSVGRIANNNWSSISPKSISKDLIGRSAQGKFSGNKSELGESRLVE